MAQAAAAAAAEVGVAPAAALEETTFMSAKMSTGGHDEGALMLGTEMLRLLTDCTAGVWAGTGVVLAAPG